MPAIEDSNTAWMGGRLTQQDNSSVETDLDTQLLSDFIYELNISRRHLATYPPGHPMIISATEKVLLLLEQLFDYRTTISFGIAKNALLFDQRWLDKNNPVYRDFATALSRLGIAAIHFHRQPTTAELNSVNQLLRADRQTIADRGGFKPLLEQLQVTHIEITAIDYNAFHSTDEDQLTIDATELPLWQDFLTALFDDSLEPTPGAKQTGQKFDPQIVAEILNHKFANDEAATEQNYHQAISSFISKLSNFEQQDQLGSQFGSLINQLNPELKRLFLNSTFRNLDHHEEAGAELLGNFPSELVVSTLEEANQNRLSISGTMLNLLGRLSAQQQRDSRQSLTSDKGYRHEDDTGLHLRTIFREEETEKFTPDSYQQTLNTIVSFAQNLQLPQDEIALLQQSMAELSIERHTSTIIFQLLETELSDIQYQGLQHNLVELARYFLEVADFCALRELHCSLLDYCHRHPQADPQHTATILETLQSPAFQQEVLDSLQRWGQDKQQQIRDYLQATGDSFAKTLVARLAEEPTQTLRRFYLNVLTNMGSSAHSAIYAALQDRRWYLVRNLVAVLRMQKIAVDLNRILPLESHPHLRVNQEVLKLLFQNDRNRADQLLLKQLGSTDNELRLHAAQLAELSNDPAVIEQLLHLLINEKLTEDSLPLKIQVIKALGITGQEHVLTSLAKLLFKRKFFGAARLLQLQLEILNQLDRYPNQAVKPLLQKLALSRRGKLSALATKKLQQRFRSSQ